MYIFIHMTLRRPGVKHRSEGASVLIQGRWIECSFRLHVAISFPDVNLIHYSRLTPPIADSISYTRARETPNHAMSAGLPKQKKKRLSHENRFHIEKRPTRSHPITLAHELPTRRPNALVIYGQHAHAPRRWLRLLHLYLTHSTPPSSASKLHRSSCARAER